MTAIFLTVMLALSQLLAPLQEPQDRDDRVPWFSRDDHYERLQTMRIWMVINALNLDMKSEKGTALLDIFKKYGDERRRLLHRREELYYQIMGEYQSAGTGGFEKIAPLVDEHNRTKNLLRRLETDEDAELAALLDTVERAKLFIADEQFKNRLHQAMGRGGRGRGQGSEGSRGKRWQKP